MSSIKLPPIEFDELNDTIVDSTIKEYSREGEIVMLIDKLKKECDHATQEFIDLVILLTEALAVISKDTSIKYNKEEIIKTLKEKKKYFIDGFVMYAYSKSKGEYRKNLLLQKEEFFLKNSFSDLTGGDSDAISKLFEFKKFWSLLIDENKNMLKQYFYTMCYFADIRYINFERYKLLRSFNQKKFMKAFNYYDQEF
jgi:hypothetical protein